MRVVRIISFTARLSLMTAMVLGLLFWIAQIPFLSILSHFFAQIGLRTIHQVFAFTGVFFFLVTALVAVWTRGTRLLGAAGVIYALIVPAFGLAQTLILVGELHWIIQAVHLLIGIGAMYLALGIEKRYQQLQSGNQSTSQHGQAALQAER